MRVSDIANWAACEAMALHSPPRQAGRTNVAAWVGTMAHALIAEEPIPDQEYGRIAYDQLTPTEHVAQVQAQSIARHARKLLVDKGWGILGQEEALGRPPELTGHLDLRAWHSDYGEAIIDLKTGAQIGAAWLQVGGYLTLYGNEVGRWPGASYGGVLHVPRTRIDRDVKGTLGKRPGLLLAQAWAANMVRIDRSHVRCVADAFAGAALRPLRGGLARCELGVRHERNARAVGSAARRQRDIRHGVGYYAAVGSAWAISIRSGCAQGCRRAGTTGGVGANIAKLVQMRQP